jgi:hypothetical protein
MPDIEQNPLDQDRNPEGLSTAALAGTEARGTQKIAEESKSFGKDGGERASPLLPEQEISDLRGRWTDIQGGFVDEPRRAVQQADELVALTMKRVAETFAQERSKLEGQWDRGDEVGTEELRVAMQRYRSFFDRLLAA